MKNKILSILLSFTLAFALWFYVATVVNPKSEATYENIPVVMDGTAALENRNLMIISDTNFHVDLKLVGNRQDLKKLNSSNITILTDLSKITEAGEHKLKYDIYYPGAVQSGNIEEQEMDPQYVTVVVVERSQKTIPVKVEYLGAVPEDFIADDAVLDHATVTITGPKDEINRIDHARITVELTGRTMDIVNTYRYSLCDRTGQTIDNTTHITASASEIKATVKINQIKKVKLVYDVISGGGIDKNDITVTPVNEEQTWITVSGSQTVLSKLNLLYIGVIDLSELTSSGRITFTIPALPEGVENISGLYTVSYDVEIPVLETRMYQGSIFQAINVPDNILLDFISEECTVWLRGSAEALDQLTADNIRVIVDYSAQTGIRINAYNRLRVTFVIVDENGNEITHVGAVTPPAEENYSYTIYAHVSMVEVDPGE